MVWGEANYATNPLNLFGLKQRTDIGRWFWGDIKNRWKVVRENIGVFVLGIGFTAGAGVAGA